MALLSPVTDKIRGAVAAATQPGFALPTASSAAVPTGVSGAAGSDPFGGKPMQGTPTVTGRPQPSGGFNTGVVGPAGQGASTASTKPVIAPVAPTAGDFNKGGSVAQAQQQGIPNSSGLTVTPPRLPGADSRTDAERQLAREQTKSFIDPATLVQKGQQAQLAQQAAQAGLSPEVAAGMQAMALAQGSADVRSKVADIQNSSYGYTVKRLDAEQTRRAQQQADAIDALLTQNVGTELWGQTIDAAIALDPENTYYRTLRDNPGLVKILGDANIAEIKKANSANSAVVLGTITDPGDEGQLGAGFGQWRDSQFSGIGNLLEAEALTYNWEDDANQADIEEYERIYGTVLDPASAADRETATAWSQYRDAVRLVTTQQVQEDLANDLLNGGVELTPENLARIEGIAGTITGLMEGSAKLGGVVSDWDGDLENGAFSIFFTDWLGNPIDGPQPSDPLQSNLNELWKEYVRQTGGQDMVSRDEFFQSAQGKVSPIETIAKGDVSSVLRDMGLGQKTPGVGGADMSITEAIASIDDPKVWQSAKGWATIPKTWSSSATYMGSKDDLLSDYESGRQGGTFSQPGTLFYGPNGEKYRVSDNPQFWTGTGANTTGVYTYVEDLAGNGNLVPLQIGKYKNKKQG